MQFKASKEKYFMPARVLRGGALAPALLVVVVAAGGLAGCSMPRVQPYRIEILQGNLVSQEMVSKLQPGMTKDQVRFIMGTPLIVNTFRDDRWDYVYSRSPENVRVPERRRISVFFESDKLKRVEGDVVAAVSAPAQPEAPAASPPVPAAGTTPPAAGTTPPAAGTTPPAASPDKPQAAQ